MKKKSLLLSLACAMLVLLFGMTANAQSEDTLEPYSYTNPAYANLESATDSASDTAEAADTSATAAAEASEN